MLIRQVIHIEFKPDLILHRDAQTSAAQERVQASYDQMRHRNMMIERSANIDLFVEGAFNYGPPRDIKIGATVILPNVVQINTIRERGEYLVIDYLQEIP